MRRYAHAFPTRLGEVIAFGTEETLTGLYFVEGRCPPFTSGPTTPLFVAVREQLDAYLAGTLRTFDLPLAADGTLFQRQVWGALTRIPYGETRTYGDVARELGTSPRAVGLANGRNPLSVVVPCHRLVGTAGALTGYAGGIARKAALLELESSGCSSSPLRSDQNATAPMSSGTQNRITR